MNRLLTTFALILSLCGGASASPYFRVIDLNHPHIVIGAYVDPFELKDTEAGSAAALLTHSPKDGCLLPSIVCEDWTPATMGWTGNSGKYKLSLGPSFNVTPLAKALLLKTLSIASKDTSLTGLKALLKPDPPDKTPTLTISLSPCYVLSPSEHFKGYFRVFMGPAWVF